MIGAGTLHATDPGHVWLPEAIDPDTAELCASYRKDALGKPYPPRGVVVSRTGKVDLARAVFRTPDAPAYILTTEAGAAWLRAAGAADLPATEVLALETPGATIPPAAMIEALRVRWGVRLLVFEGGPTLYGEFITGGRWMSFS